jgi:putative membrane protein
MASDQLRPADHFAWLRTSMALQRTLLASVRTAVSLIGFGFTVAQFFQKLAGGGAEGLHQWSPELPRNIGLVLIAAGVISLGAASLQYSRVMKHLTTGDYGPLAGPHRRTMHGSTYFVALVVLLIGCVAFISVLARF